jgi:hypothetical protein
MTPTLTQAPGAPTTKLLWSPASLWGAIRCQCRKPERHLSDGQLNFVKENNEWTGTEIVFEINQKGPKTELRFTHVGLVPAFECYGGCSGAWGFLISDGLRTLIRTGKGQPYKREWAVRCALAIEHIRSNLVSRLLSDRKRWLLRASSRFRLDGVLETPLGNRPHSAARAETTGYARSSGRAFGSQPRGRLHSAVWDPAPRTCVPVARFRQWYDRRPCVLIIQYEVGKGQMKGVSVLLSLYTCQRRGRDQVRGPMTEADQRARKTRWRDGTLRFRVRHFAHQSRPNRPRLSEGRIVEGSKALPCWSQWKQGGRVEGC